MSDFAELVRDAKALMSNITAYAANVRPSDATFDKAEALWDGLNKGLEDAGETHIDRSFERTVMLGAPSKKPNPPPHKMKERRIL